MAYSATDRYGKHYAEEDFFKNTELKVKSKQLAKVVLLGGELMLQ
jgi:hypothetical protein